MTDVNTLKPMVQKMLDVSNEKGSFDRADLEGIRDNAPSIQAVIAQDFMNLSAKQVVDMWDTASQAGAAEGVTIEVPKAVNAAVSCGRSAPGAFQSTVGGTPYTEITKQTKEAKHRER